MGHFDRLFSVNFDDDKSVDYLTSVHRRMLTYGNILIFGGFVSIFISSNFTNTISDQTFLGIAFLSGLMIASSSRYYNTAKEIENFL